MAYPATQDDVARVARAVEALERRMASIQAQTLDNSEHVKRIHQEITAALTAIGDEQVEGDSSYAAAVQQSMQELRDELRVLYQYLKHSLEEVDVSNQRIRQALEEHGHPDQRKIFG